MNLIPDSLRALGRGIALAALVVATAGPAAIASAQVLRQQKQTPPPPQPQTEVVDRNELFREPVAKPLEAADALIKAGKYQEAMARIREADLIADRTPLEAYLIDRMRGITASGLGDTKTAIASFEAVLASGRSPPDEQLKLTEAIAAMYFKAEDYRNATSWTQRYLKAGGTNPDMRMQLVRSLYLSEQHAAAATELRALIDADEKSGATPALDRLQLLGSAYVKMNDGAGSAYVLEKLLAYYPKKEYWTDAIGRVQRKQGFPEHLQLDVLRLQEATGSLTDAAQYTAMAQLALRIGQPGEAKRVIDRGFAAGVLGTGPDADQQRKLRDTTAKQVADDEKALAQNAKDAAAAKDGNALLNVGYAMVNAGQFDQGIALMEQGIQKGGLRQPEEAKLHLAIAYLAAGQKAKAVAAFKTVQGSDATADLARLWLIHAQRTSG
jgi:tetratricopeptide (TPR) repeat protein